MRLRIVTAFWLGLGMLAAVTARAGAQTAGPATGTSGALVGAGVSFFDLGSSTGNGFSIDIRRNVRSADAIDVGIVGDLGWHRDSAGIEGFEFTFTMITALAGARVTASQLDRAAPFAQILTGLLRGSIGGPGCRIEQGFCRAQGATDGVIGLGAGLDVKLADRLNFRAQYDWLKILEKNAGSGNRFFIGLSTPVGG